MIPRRKLHPSDEADRPRSTRAQGRPGAGRTHGPPANKKAGGSHHRFGLRPSLRDGFPAYACSPRRPGFLAPVMSRSFCSLGLSVGRPGPHGFAVRNRIGRPRKDCALIPPRPSHPASRFVTIAHTPVLPRRDRCRMLLIWGPGQVVFCKSECVRCVTLARRAVFACPACADCPSGSRCRIRVWRDRERGNGLGSPAPSLMRSGWSAAKIRDDGAAAVS
jgi:hypothetical protein